MEDFKGMQVSAPPGLEAKALQALGATPVMLSLAEMYAALERGLVDGMPTTKELIVSMKLYEVAKYHTMASMCNGISTVVMNQNTWNSLPPDVQKVFDELSPWAQKLLNDAADAYDEDADSVFKAAGCEIINLSPEEKAKWIKATEPLIDEWIAEMNAKGLPGSEIVKEARRLSAGQ
jgi:TRAP-type C4-dicarboxylate transport system substrate-binding protein